MLVRLLNSEYAEVYEIRKSLYGDLMYYMIFFDYHRKACIEDFEHIRGYSDENFRTSDNYIQVVVIQDVQKHITNDEKKELYEIAGGFLEGKENCAWIMKFIKKKVNDYLVVGVNKKKLINMVNDIYYELNGVNLNLVVEEESFNNLMQK